MSWFQNEFDKYTALVLQQVVNSDMFVSNLTAQKGYLEFKGRKPVAILLGENGIRNLLSSLHSDAELEKIIAMFEKENRCLFRIFNVPVYFSALLEKTPIMVIGEISWKTNERNT